MSIKLCNQIPDKLGYPINIYLSYKTHKKDVLSLMLLGWKDLLSENKTITKFWWEDINKSYAIWAENSSGKVISILFFKICSDWQAGKVLFAFTVPEYRNKRLVNFCFKEYVKKLKEEGVLRTHATMAVNNNEVYRKDSKGIEKNVIGSGMKYVVYTKKITN